MFDPFDIFQIEEDGGMRWVEAAVTLQAAERRVHQLAARLPGAYVILEQDTQSKHVINPEGGIPAGSRRLMDVQRA